MKTWRERMALAENRYYAPWKNIWRRFLLGNGWPFTDADHQAMSSLSTCAAGELVKDYGLPHVSIQASRLYDLGTKLQMVMHSGNVPRAIRILNEMEDRALEAKRELA